MTSLQAVGVVGVGAMGAPIAGHLARAGYPVTVVDRDPAAASATGPPVAASVADLAGSCEIVIVTVDDDAAVRDVVGGLVDADVVVLICSTVAPSTVRELAERAGRMRLLDAAMVGGVRGARAGTLTLLVGGDADLLWTVRAELAPWTAIVHHVGPLGAGQVAKSANNLIHWSQVCAIPRRCASSSAPASRCRRCGGRCRTVRPTRARCGSSTRCS